MNMPLDFSQTADFVYARFHGLSGGYAHNYTREELRPWTDELGKVRSGGGDAFAYFNNDADTRAPGNARDLIKMLAAEP
jgi:uncharacterized protein YecE (DUF72 family)